MSLLALRAVCRPSVALLLAAAVALCAPSHLLAGCGDYVSMAPGHQEAAPHAWPAWLVAAPDNVVTNHSARLDLLNQQLAWPGTLRPAPCRRCPAVPGQAPCRGPWCSGKPVPLPAPPSITAPPLDPWAAAWADLAAVLAPARLACADEYRARVHHVFPIFHPPRPF